MNECIDGQMIRCRNRQFDCIRHFSTRWRLNADNKNYFFMARQLTYYGKQIGSNLINESQQTPFSRFNKIEIKYAKWTVAGWISQYFMSICSLGRKITKPNPITFYYTFYAKYCHPYISEMKISFVLCFPLLFRIDFMAS